MWPNRISEGTPGGPCASGLTADAQSHPPGPSLQRAKSHCPTLIVPKPHNRSPSDGGRAYRTDPLRASRRQKYSLDLSAGTRSRDWSRNRHRGLNRHLRPYRNASTTSTVIENCPIICEPTTTHSATHCSCWNYSASSLNNRARVLTVAGSVISPPRAADPGTGRRLRGQQPLQHAQNPD